MTAQPRLPAGHGDLIRCGLRVSDALKLPLDCTVTDDAGAPYLRYRNNKMNAKRSSPSMTSCWN